MATKASEIQIPEDAVRCVVRGRHSHSVQDGPNETRTLTSSGAALCVAVRNEYAVLIGGSLMRQFGHQCMYACSEYPRSLLTTFLVTNAEQIVRDSRLNLDASVKKAPAPAGSKHPNLHAHWKAEGLSVSDMLRRLAADPSLFGPQPVARALANATDFVRNAFPEGRLVITFDHEPAISLYAAQVGAKPELLGLEECQAFLFFLDDGGNVISVQKFTPPATFPTPTK
ncbi:MAG: hypothetical protein HYV42_02925 [Candidatus Magasanikbacteria bacterium]|nr:hypothetical protein [Candidatus Magasanikbacteria bacterium]